MYIFNHLLVATDCSERAERAEARAALLVQEHKCDVAELLTVRECGEPEILAQIMNSTVASATALVAENAGRVLAYRADVHKDNYGVQFTCKVRFGRPASEIVIRAEELRTDLVVIGAHGGNFFSDLLLGNTADKLTHLCKSPLLVVKNKPSQSYQRVLVPVDFSEDSRRAAEAALAIAPQADITFLHAFEVLFEGKMQYANVAPDIIDEYRMKAFEDAREQLNQLIGGIEAGGRRMQRAITFGLPGPVVRDYAKATRPDLIVLGKHGRSRIEEMLLGSVTRDAIDQTESDVLVVPAAGGT
ncbi:MAG TPA: universal stress protein [Noviherbaspirillum sp.]|uniref:universal stress protein n=1 Tax=Noviherbaspirillum sp. TaxID=1926288 RepID=UPI002D55199C|nr:universal stress protein [Noviherbaspirillum sp.]HYD94697.1 universal stress protein [Noviherbaspirillum sp.]